MHLVLFEYKYNLFFLVSCLCLTNLFIPINTVDILLEMLCSAFFVYWSVYKNNWKIELSKKISSIIYSFLLTCVVLVILGKIILIKYNNFPAELYFPFVLSSFCIYIGMNQASKKVKLKKLTFRSFIPYIYFFIVSAVFTAICSRTSMLYTINDASDPNIFFNVGKSMMNGKVLYRDIFEQKGFYIFILHGIASLISSTSMIGVYYLEVLANWAFLIIGRKIYRLYIKNDFISLIIVPICFAIYVASLCFWYGDNAEELCSPFLIYGLYILLKNLKYKTFPSKKEYFLIGLTSGFILWLKYTMLGFYVGWYIVPFALMIMKKQWKEIPKSIGWIALGVLGASLPVLLYFIFNNSLQYLWEVYFYDNMFLYSTKVENQSAINAVFESVSNNIILNPQLSVLVLLSLIWMLFQTSLSESLGYLCCFLGLIISIFIGGRYYSYYYSCVAVFIFPGCIYIYCLIRNLTGKFNLFGVILISLTACIIYVLLTSRNVPYINRPEESYPQYKFAQIMKQVKSPTLLNYGVLDNGFNMYADILPGNRFYCTFNVPLEEISEEQNKILQEGSVDFFIYYFPDLQLDNYELVATEEYDRGEGTISYNLYARKDLSINENKINGGE